MNGYSGTSVIANMFGDGATQISGGTRGYTSRNPGTSGSFYYGGVGGISDGTPTVSGGAGGGGASCVTGTTDNLCSVHYSGKVFTGTVMIDGTGYSWTNTKGALRQMPNPSGGYYASGVGKSGNGYAKITFLHP